MGLETTCLAHIGGRQLSGKLHIDSKELAFSAPGLRWKQPLAGLTATIAAGWLSAADARFELGDACATWKRKIEHPPTRLIKLGIKQDLPVWLGGACPKDIPAELEEGGARLVRSLRQAQLGIFFLESRDALPDLARLAEDLGDRNLWAVYPKGGKTIKEAELFALGNEFGWGVSKTMSFDDRLTAMRFARRKSA